jgi:four helix bundle protein
MDYRDLVAWQKAMDLVEGIYLATAEFPREERYGLSSQVRRAAVSVPSNIAGGQGRRTSDDEFVRFLQIAMGSLAELQTSIGVGGPSSFLRSATSDCSAIIERRSGTTLEWTREIKEEAAPLATSYWLPATSKILTIGVSFAF